MCGIAGFKRFGKTLVTQSQISIMLTGIEKRGNQATGISIQHKDGQVFTLKDDEPAWRFVASGEFQDFLKKYNTEDVSNIILHARAATKGSPSDNANNHPLTLGKVSVVHNGHIWNDDETFKRTGLHRSGQVDSDVFRALLDAHGLTREGIQEINKLRGSAAIAAVSVEQPGVLLLARSGNPIVTASTRDMLVFASEKRFIHAAMRPIIKRFGLLFQPNIPDVAFNTMQDHSAWLIGPEGLEWHDRFELSQHFTPVSYDVHGTYHRKRGQWYTEKLPDVLVCPNPECGVANRVPEWAKGDPIHKLRCEACKSPMGSLTAVA